jgi:hypothetical protein
VFLTFGVIVVEIFSTKKSHPFQTSSLFSEPRDSANPFIAPGMSRSLSIRLLSVFAVPMQ